MAGTAVTTLDDVHHVAEQVQTGLTQLLTAEYWKLPGPDLLDAARTEPVNLNEARFGAYY
jgi:hypothetical protein